MNSKTTIPITEARKRIYEIANEITTKGKRYFFTERGKPTLVLMSLEEYEGWNETMEILKEMPDIMKDIKKAEKEYREGKTISFEKVLRELGYNKLADDYENRISNRAQPKRPKRAR